MAGFSPFFFAGKSFLPVDLYQMLYKPFAADYPRFSPYNHFDDDILKFCYLYQWGAREFLYRPYWIPEIFGGIPLYANTYASHFSPLNWILRLAPLSVSYPLKLLCSLWIAGNSMFALGRHLRLSFWPALLAGLCYMFSGLFITMLLRWWIPGAFSWVPYLLIATSFFFGRRARLGVAAAALALALAFLDGFFQTSASILLAWAVFLLTQGWFRARWVGAVRATIAGTLTVCLAFALSAVMWLPQLEYFYLDTEKGSSRASGIYFEKNLVERILSVPALLAAFFPQILGSPQTMDLAKIFHSHLQDFAPFIGTIPLLFALATWNRRRASAETYSLWSLVFLGLFIPIATPLDRYLYFRFIAVYIVGIAALAGVGFEYVLSHPADSGLKRLKRAGIALWGAIGIGSLSVRAILWAFPGRLEERAAAYVAARVDQTVIGSRNPEWMVGRAREFVHFVGFGSSVFTIAFVLGGIALLTIHLWQRGRLERYVFTFLVFGLSFSQLWIGIHSWFGFHSLVEFPLFPENEIATFFRSEDAVRNFRATVNDFHGLKGEKELQIIPANTNFFFGYSTLEGFDGVRPGTIFDLPHSDLAAKGKLNVKYLITNAEPAINDPNLILRHRGRVAIYENRLVRPRASIVGSYRVSGREAIRSEIAEKGIPEGSVFLEQSPAGFKENQNRNGKVSLLQSGRLFTKYQVSGGPGLFTSTETFYPGWSATWNGRATPVLRANVYMRAVALPSESGVLEFHFVPRIYRIGLMISGLALAIWLTVVTWGLRTVGREQQVLSG